MESKKKILALFGKSGSGKSTIQQYLVEQCAMNSIIACTTRPKREREQNGKDYYFLTENEFNNQKMLEITKFNNWFYGTPIEALKSNTINIGVFNIQSIEQLLQNNELEIVPVYIWCPDKDRLLRNLTRETFPNCIEICRRFLTDEEDFNNISFEYEFFDNSHDVDFRNLLNRPMVAEMINHIK